MEEKGCQSEEFFYGYTVEKPIPHKETGAVRRPDVVGVRYERSDTKTPSYSSHFHLVEVKAGADSQQIQNVIGEIEALRQHAKNAVLAADTVSYYVAVPTVDVPDNLREWAKGNGVGILSVETNDGEVIFVRELLGPELVDRGIKRSEFLSNTSQRSPGNFRRAVERTSVLKQIMEPKDFFEARIRPEL